MRHLCSHRRCESSNTCNGPEGNKEFVKSGSSDNSRIGV